eukprot:6196150-Pleurochrysis_carterae.AAC.2
MHKQARASTRACSSVSACMRQRMCVRRAAHGDLHGVSISSSVHTRAQPSCVRRTRTRQDAREGLLSMAKYCFSYLVFRSASPVAALGPHAAPPARIGVGNSRGEGDRK